MKNLQSSNPFIQKFVQYISHLIVEEPNIKHKLDDLLQTGHSDDVLKLLPSISNMHNKTQYSSRHEDPDWFEGKKIKFPYSINKW